MRFLYKPINDIPYMLVRNMTKEQWNNLIANPYVQSDKKDVPLAIWGDMVDNPEMDEYGENPRCIGSNVRRMYALQVDVDNGCKIEEFVKDFHRYKFHLYTSYSYGVFKPGDRYRVIFPLKEPIYVDNLVRPVKDKLVELFSMSDVTCFDKGHFQCMPAISSNDAPYRFLQHDGELLSFATENFPKMAREYYEELEGRRKAKEEESSGDNHTAALNKAQIAFDASVEGTRNSTVYGWMRWLSNEVGCTYQELASLRPPFGMPMEEFYGIIGRVT